MDLGYSFALFINELLHCLLDASSTKALRAIVSLSFANVKPGSFAIKTAHTYWEANLV